MKISKLDAKEWAKEHLKGIFGAAPVPYYPSGEIDENGFRSNLRYWRDVLQIKGQWVAGFQSEQLGISTKQRKRIFEITQEESQGKQIAICAIMNDVIQDALDLAKFADDMGADSIGLSGPRIFNIFTGMSGGQVSEDTLFHFFEYISERINVPIILLNQATMQGYTMSPRLIARIAELPNCVALKNVVGGDLDHYHETRKLCGDKIVVSDPNESLFFKNYTEHRQRAFIATPAPMLLQTRDWQPINEYVRLADEGNISAAAKVNADLDIVRTALEVCLHKLGWYKYTALQKYWFELQGLCGGRVVYPQQELTAQDKDFVKRQFDECGLGKAKHQGRQAA
jgi:4-hydroxy-tetrahydrodipicolinate synthase